MAKTPKTPKSPKSAKGQDIRFFLNNGRPGAGTKLASHTAAVLELTGLSTGGLFPAADLRKLIGETAFGYHSRKGNLIRTEDGVKLSDDGIAHFLGRTAIQPDPEQVKAFQAILTTGQPDGNLVKNAGFIKPLKAEQK